MPGEALTSPRRVSSAQRGDEAVRLRVQGYTLDEIAVQLGYSNRGAAHKAITGSLKRQGKPAAEELAAIHLAQLEAVKRKLMDKLLAEKITVGALAKVTLGVVRVLQQESRYVDVYSQSQGLGAVSSLLEKLLDSPPPGADPDDDMTVPTVDLSE